MKHYLFNANLLVQYVQYLTRLYGVESTLNYISSWVSLKPALWSREHSHLSSWVSLKPALWSTEHSLLCTGWWLVCSLHSGYPHPCIKNSDPIISAKILCYHRKYGKKVCNEIFFLVNVCGHTEEILPVYRSLQTQSYIYSSPHISALLV